MSVRWINRDFSKIVENHNYFRGLQDGSIGKATAAMNKIEVTTFVLNTFGD